MVDRFVTAFARHGVMACACSILTGFAAHIEAAAAMQASSIYGGFNALAASSRRSPANLTIHTNYDGEWTASNDSWKITLQISEGRVSGRILACFRKHGPEKGSWSDQGPEISGTINIDGHVDASSSREGRWEIRVIRGKFPTLDISASGFFSECENGAITFVRAR